MAAAGSRGRKAAVGVLASALVVSGLLMGVSYGSAGITVPTEIQVFIADEDAATSHSYPLREADGTRSGHLSTYKDLSEDVDGNPIGKVRVVCIDSAGVMLQCFGVATIKAGPHNEAGTITFYGNFSGFNGEVQAVTGGTGAYENARGTVTNTVIDDQLVRVFSLLP
jgi:hypothetical protein